MRLFSVVMFGMVSDAVFFFFNWPDVWLRILVLELLLERFNLVLKGVYCMFLGEKFLLSKLAYRFLVDCVLPLC